MTDIKKIRNFATVAHIDHGKSTLADRLLEKTNILKKDHIAQVLDSMPIEREKGITIKASFVRMEYKDYVLNLIDTPGHVDFSYEVSRSIAATEGVILLIDASQGPEAQTLAHFLLAKELNKVIIPVINKIDLPNIDFDWLLSQINGILKLNTDDLILISAKENIGIQEVLDAVIERIPAPSGNKDAPLKGLVFDSWFDTYKGVIVAVRIFDGSLKKSDIIKFMSNQQEFKVENVYVMQLDLKEVDELSAGEVGCFCAQIRDIKKVNIGDTVTHAHRPVDKPLSGFKKAKPVVFCSFYPADGIEFERLKAAIEKLALNDASWEYKEELSLALGLGYRCGFLGSLHAEIIKERLEREYRIDVVMTVPRVVYKVIYKDQKQEYINNPAKFPDTSFIKEIFEPYVLVKIITPLEYLESIALLLKEKKGAKEKIEYIEGGRVLLEYQMPFSCLIAGFFDKLKSCSKGFASLDYTHIGYKKTQIVKVEILVNGQVIDELSFFAYPDEAYRKAVEALEKLRKQIPRQLFEVVLQAKVKGKIIAKQRIVALAKDVTAKCYGGDVTRKIKLWDKQKEGKKKLKQIGRVNIPHEAFKAVLEI